MEGAPLPAPEGPASLDPAALLAEVRAFVAGPLEAAAGEIERGGAVPRSLWAELNRRGYLRLAAPAEYGGAGLPFPVYVEVLEAFSQAHGSLRMIVHVNNGIWRPLARRATPEQIERFVRPQVEGRHTVAFTLTEPDSGSGADIQTTARRDGDRYLLNGEKHLITFGLVADYYLLFCRLEGSSGADGTLALMVPRHAPGLHAESMGESIGLRGTDHAHLHMTDCAVPVNNRLGEEGQGLDVALRGFLDASRICVAASCVGLAQRALDLAVARAKARVTFGRPIAARQAIQMRLAEMETDVEAARQLVRWAAARWVAEPPAAAAAAKAKLFALEMLQRVTDGALQVWGGAGYFEGSPIARLYRDARAQRFEEGTAEIQKATIARELLA
jgi:alkylation response protein AidB-like acyl-CoA dehydrogenase